MKSVKESRCRDLDVSTKSSRQIFDHDTVADGEKGEDVRNEIFLPLIETFPVGLIFSEIHLRHRPERCFRSRGVSWGGGALGAWAPRSHQRGAKKKKNERERKREERKQEKREKEGNKKEKKKRRKREQERKKKEKKLNQYEQRGAMQFQVQAGDSREENVRGAKLTEKRTGGAPCGFKCKQGLQGRKRQGRQIDGEKDERGAMQFQVQAGAPGKKTSGAPN